MSTDNEAELDREIARLQAMISSPKAHAQRAVPNSKQPYIRPRNAASMILVDGKGDDLKILMGKRNHNLKFMPGALVFPGGSVDPYDGSVGVCEELAAPTLTQLLNNMRGRPTKRGARALALAAIRETAEETGILIGQNKKFDLPSLAHKDWAFFDRQDITPSLAGFALLSRAITPPGLPRRFDTWFFVATTDCVAHIPEAGFDPSGELEDLQWISPRDAIKADTREITRVMLVELMDRLKADPELTPGYPAPHYFFKSGNFSKAMMTD